MSGRDPAADYRHEVTGSVQCLYVVARMLVDYWDPTGDVYQRTIAAQLAELCTELNTDDGALSDDGKRQRVQAILDGMRATVDDLLKPAADFDALAARVDRVEAMAEELRAATGAT